MRTIKFDGQEFEYDETALKDYGVQKGLALGMDNVPRFFRAVEKVFAGKDEEYAEKLGGDLTQLTKAVFEDAAASEVEVKN